MNSMGFQSVFAILLLFIGTVKATRVIFSGMNFTMFCPWDGEWFKNDEKIEGQTELYSLKYNSDNKGLYYCQNGGEKYYFYVKGKVCENCTELDATLVLLVMMVDGLGTALLMILIYRCTKKKSSAGPTYSSKAPAHSGGRAPPVPSPDYEQLNTHTRSQDTYSIVNRTG